MHAIRSQSGQGLSEAACGLSFAALVVVLIITGGINIYFYINYDAKVRYIAKEASRCLKEQIWYDGMERPVARQRLELQRRLDRVASTLKNNLALPGSLSLTFNDPTVQLKNGGANSNNVLCSVSVTASNLPLPFSLGLFPSATKISRTFHSMATSFAPMAVCNLEDATGRGVQVPAYFFYRRTGQTITRERYTGGRGVNLGRGTYLSGFICNGTPDQIRYTPGDTGVWHKVPFGVGLQHGPIQSEAYTN